MALITIQFHAKSLARSVPLRAFLPVDGDAPPDTPLPTLYLLHGLNGSENDWFTYSRAALYAREFGLAVFCPAGENSFYVPQAASGIDYLRFVGEELPAFTRRLFPLSAEREKTFIGGLSMGGYGALNAGYVYPQTFGKVVALSAALEPWRLMTQADSAEPVRRPRYARALFGESPYAGDTLTLARKCGSRAPEIHMACGAEDALLPVNIAFTEALRAEGLPPAHFDITPGAHTWDFWDREIRRGMQFLMDRPIDAPLPAR